MSLIADIGRKTLKNRLIMLCIYLSLTLMGITMVVPFLITLSGSAANDFDYDRFSPLPRYLWSREDRYVKALVPYFNLYRNWTRQFQAYFPNLPEHWSSWTAIGQDQPGIDYFAREYLSLDSPAAAADYAEFNHTYPLEDCQIYAPPIQVIAFLIEESCAQYRQQEPQKKLSRAELHREALKLLGQQWGVPFETFYSINFNVEMRYPLDFQSWFPDAEHPKMQAYNRFKEAAAAYAFTPGSKRLWRKFLLQRGYPGQDLFPVSSSAPPELQSLWLEFKKTQLPASPKIPFPLRSAWYSYLGSEEVAAQYNGQKLTIAQYNACAGTIFPCLAETPFPLPPEYPNELQKHWRNFCQERYPLRLISLTVTPALEQNFQQFTQAKIRHLRSLNKLLGTSYQDWSQLKLSSTPAAGSTREEQNRRDLWKNFVRSLPLEHKQFHSSEIAFQAFLRQKYPTLEAVNQAYGWNLPHWNCAFPPFAEAYAQTFRNNGRAMTFLPVLDNYKMVMNYMLFNGNAIVVTLVLITLTILCTLTINPMAAYALSRFNLKFGNQILVFLLATMAFPAMVSAIPAYLLMRDLGLLNTYLALILPGAANGMAIFILKGFFDSLPMELFEAATIDGASELQIFRIVAMPLVKPILAINTLNAFVAAYNGWEWALIICQDKEMWTIAVWMYQASIWWRLMPWVVSAGFVLTSIPTMLVFISCQKIILRGIIIPSMK